MNDRARAVDHLRRTCVPQPANKDDNALAADWQTAKGAIGTAPVANAGNPAIAPIPPRHPHIVQMMNDPWTRQAVAQFYPDSTFQMVEIDPLFAFHIAVDTQRATNKCAHLSNPPVADELFPICLPIGQPEQPYQFSVQGQSLVAKAKGLNMRLFPVNVARDQSAMRIEVTFAFGPEFVCVTRYQNRSFLSNGFHRAYGIRSAGHTHMPCIFRDVATPAEVGFVGDDTFSPTDFQGPDAPTLAHFAQGRAFVVNLRETSRVLTVSWSEHAVADE